MDKLNCYPRPADDVVGKVLANEAVLVLTQRAQIKVVNEVGALIWSLADGSRSIAQIAERVCQEYEVSAQQANDDTLRFVDDLVARGALVLMDNPRLLPGANPAW